MRMTAENCIALWHSNMLMRHLVREAANYLAPLSLLCSMFELMPVILFLRSTLEQQLAKQGLICTIIVLMYD